MERSIKRQDGAVEFRGVAKSYMRVKVSTNGSERGYFDGKQGTGLYLPHLVTATRWNRLNAHAKLGPNGVFGFLAPPPPRFRVGTVRPC